MHSLTYLLKRYVSLLILVVMSLNIKVFAQDWDSIEMLKELQKTHIISVGLVLGNALEDYHSIHGQPMDEERFYSMANDLLVNDPYVKAAFDYQPAQQFILISYDWGNQRPYHDCQRLSGECIYIEEPIKGKRLMFLRNNQTWEIDWNGSSLDEYREPGAGAVDQNLRFWNSMFTITNHCLNAYPYNEEAFPLWPPLMQQEEWCPLWHLYVKPPARNQR